VSEHHQAAMRQAKEAQMRWHELKTDPDVFDAVALGLKTFEIRKDDRGFKVGDGLLLRRTRASGLAMKNGAALEYTGEEERRVITHILAGPVYGLAEGWVILSIAPLSSALAAGEGVESVAGAMLSADDAAFLAARLRRLFAHFAYPLPPFAERDESLLRIAGSCIGGVLTQLASPTSGNSAAAEPVAEVVRGRPQYSGVRWLDERVGNALPDGTKLYASPVPEKAAVPGERVDLDWLLDSADTVLARCLKHIGGSLERDVNLMRNSLRVARKSLPHQEGHHPAAPAEPCPKGDDRPEKDCTNRHQCWEPCGELGNDVRYARVSRVSPAGSPAGLSDAEATYDECRVGNVLLDKLMLERFNTTQWPANWMEVRRLLFAAQRLADPDRALLSAGAPGTSSS